MKRLTAAICVTSLFIAASAVARPACPPREAGSAYPWQSFQPMRGDQQAVVFIDVDRTGHPLRCAVGKNNIPDPETRFRLCRTFMDDWQAPAAAPSDPAIRTIKRDFTMLGNDHQLADEKARKQFFKDHPEERPECYPTDY
jgi:hypothetical protein